VGLRRILLYGLGVLVIAGAFALGLAAFETQREHGRKVVTIGAGKDGIGVGARVIGVDPNLDAMTVRLEFSPLGSFARTQIVLAKPVDIFISTVKGRSVVHYDAGQVMSPTEATVALNEGQVLDYPFDRYDAALLVFAGSGSDDVPVTMQVTTGFNGFKIDTSRARFQGQGYPTFKLRRATTTIFWALFVDVMFWVTALSALGLAVRLAEHRRKFEAGFTGFLAALLFAFPAVRNALPGNPPIGALNDFLAFFWTEGIVALSLIGLLVTYYVRRLPGAAPPAE
jgi:Domain of unknown function (DUF4436)